MLDECKESADSVAALAASLLGSEPRPAAAAPAPRGGWWAIPITCFIAYHLVTLGLQGVAAHPLGRRMHDWSEKWLHYRRYAEATGNVQSWGMFAPNPPRENVFVRVLVRDENGALHDLQHDIHGRRHHPYLFYEHMGKVNQRIAEEPSARRVYAAWVCREWEREHGGNPASDVQMVELTTRIPAPHEAPRGYDPQSLAVHERLLDAYDCDVMPWAQLPPRLRERYGLEPIDSGRFRPAVMRTWADRHRRAADSDAAGGGE